MLVSSGCCTKITIVWVMYKQKYILVLEAGHPRQKYWKTSCVMKPCFSLCPHVIERKQAHPGSLKQTPSWKAPPLLFNPSHPSKNPPCNTNKGAKFPCEFCDEIEVDSLTLTFKIVPPSFSTLSVLSGTYITG